MTPLENAINNHKWEAIPLLQGGDKDYYEKLVVSNLDIVARVNAFLRLFDGEGREDSNNHFQRGFVIGIISSIMVSHDANHKADVMDDVLILIAMLSAKNVNIMTGKELKSESPE